MKQCGYWLSDEWDLLDSSVTKTKDTKTHFNELRAQMVYEYARESPKLVKLVDSYRKNWGSKKRAAVSGADLQESDASARILNEIEHYSFLIGLMVPVMGRQATLQKSWKSLGPLRRKMVEATIRPARIAYPAEVSTICQKRSHATLSNRKRRFRREGPIFVDPESSPRKVSLTEQLFAGLLGAEVSKEKSGRKKTVLSEAMGNPWSIGAKDARLFVPLLLDGSLPVSQLKREVDKVLSAAVYRWLPPSKGVNAKGLSSISTALRDLSLLRFLSKRKIDDALGGPLLKGFDDTTAYDRVAAALEIFRGLFPGLGCDARVCGQTIEDIFPGYAAYKKAHPRFGR